MDIAEGDSKPVSLLLHRRKTPFVRKGPPTEQNRLACLTVEDGKRLRTAGKAQSQDIERVGKETSRLHVAIVADLGEKLDYRVTADEPDFPKTGFRIRRPSRT